MYTVSKGPSKIVAKTRRGLTQNYEKFETIKESGKRSEKNSPENMHVPRPVFQTIKKPAAQTSQTDEEVITPQHEEIIKYINDSWNIIMADNPYDSTCNGSTNGGSTNGTVDPNNNNINNNSASSSKASSAASSASTSTCSSPVGTPPPALSATSPIYCIEPPSPVLSDFKPFDLESWWGRRLFNNITKTL